MNKRLQIFLFVAICLSGIIYAILQRKELEENYIVSIGQINDVEFTSKSSDYYVSYIIPETKGVYKSSLAYVRFSDIVFLKNLLIDKKLPVIFQKNKPENNRMLFLKKDYDKFRIIPSRDQQIIINSIDSLSQYK